MNILRHRRNWWGQQTPPPGYPGPGFYASGGNYPPYFNPPPNYNGGMNPLMVPPDFHSGYMSSDGQQYRTSGQAQGYRTAAQNSGPQASKKAVKETQKANTIRNEVNLKKASLRLVEDEQNPGENLVAFSFDATVDGCISIFFLSREKDQCSFTPVKPSLYQVSRAAFEKGLAQKFQQLPGAGVNLALFDETDIITEEDGVYPLVVRTETLGKDPPPNFSLYDDDGPLGAPVPKYVHCQTTQAVIEKNEDGHYKVKVVRQTLWVEGKYYELKEIYGAESSGTGPGLDDNDEGKECVICLSEPRDTTVLPCRHMCMCHDCAKTLKSNTNKCPICRTPVEQILEIKVRKTENHDPKTATFSAGASSSQASYPRLDQLTLSEKTAKEEVS